MSIIESVEELKFLLSDLGFKGKGLGEKKEKVPGGTTGKMLKEQLGKLNWFRGWKNDDWFELGRFAKSKRITASVFSGALSAFLKFIHRGNGFPATIEYCKENRLAPDTEKTLGILERNLLLISEEITVGNILENKPRNINITDIEKSSFARMNKQNRVDVYFYDEVFYDLWKFFKSKKVKKLPKIESIKIVNGEMIFG